MSKQTVSVWLGYRASIWAHRGYTVLGERVECEDRKTAEHIVAESVAPLDELYCFAGSHYYMSKSDADADPDGSFAEAVIEENE